MATNTTNYNWKKPDYEDDADIKDLNDNFDGIDAQVKAIDDQVQLIKNNLEQMKLDRYIANTSKTYTLASNTPYIITVNSYGTYGMFMAFKYSDETTPRLYEIKKSSSFDALITVTAVASSSDISIAPVSSSTWYVSSGMKL